MGATLVTPRVAKSVDGEVGFYSTYGWHPLSVCAAIVNVRWFVRTEKRLMRDVNAISGYFAGRLGAMKFREVRVRGMAIAAETRSAPKIAERCRENGLLLTRDGDGSRCFRR
jgi:putrescine aminotransferase